MIVVKTKKCTKCKRRKLINKFHNHKYSKDGLNSWCKLCNIKNVNSWCKTNPDKLKLNQLKYRKNHPDRIRIRRRNWHRKIRATSTGKLDHRISTSIQQALKGNKAGRHWEILVGWTLNDLKKDFESKYYNGMTWDSFIKGKIELHHIIKRSKFHYKTAEDPEFKACWALSNLQPLWKKDHIELHKNE